MTELQRAQNIHASKKRINIVTFGAVLKLTFEDDAAADAWWIVLKKLLRGKFSREELKAKEEARLALEPLLDEQENLQWARHEAILKALAASGFWQGKEKKLHEGYLKELRRKRSAKKVYTVLFRDYLYFFKPHEKVSANERPADMVALKFVSSIDYEKDSKTAYRITTPLRSFILKAKHEVAAAEWINAIRSQLERKGGDAETPSTNATKVQASTKGYAYSKQIAGRLSLLEKSASSGSTKTHKIKKADVITVGRSSSAEVRLVEDRYISRQHFKISIEDNVPFCVDLGQSKEGTYVNGKKITKCALKPGDVIKAGDTELTFEVKDAHEIFVQTRSDEKSSDSSSAGDKKKKVERKKKKPKSDAVMLEKDD